MCLFCVTRSNPTHQLTDPTQPNPTHGQLWLRSSRLVSLESYYTTPNETFHAAQSSPDCRCEYSSRDVIRPRSILSFCFCSTTTSASRVAAAPGREEVRSRGHGVSGRSQNAGGCPSMIEWAVGCAWKERLWMQDRLWTGRCLYRRTGKLLLLLLTTMTSHLSCPGCACNRPYIR